MIPRKSLLSWITLFALLTSCTDDVGPEISYGLIRISVTTAAATSTTNIRWSSDPG